MMRHFTLLISILLPLWSWATNLDSLLYINQHTPDNSEKIEALSKLSNLLISNNQFHQADSVLDLALIYPATNIEKADIYLLKFGAKLRKGDINGLEQVLAKIREYIGDDTTSIIMGKYLSNLGIYYNNKREPLKALKSLLRGKQLMAQDPTYSPITENHNLSIVYQDVEAYDLALKLTLENQKIALKNGAYLEALFNYYSSATTYFEIEEYDKAKEVCFKAIELKENHRVSTAFGYMYYMLGLTLVEESKLDSAIYYFQKGIDLSKKQGERKELSDNHRGMCLVMLRKGDLSKALYHGKLSEDLATYFDENLYLYLAEIYQHKGNYEKAFEALKRVQNYQEALTKNTQSYKLVSTLLADKFEQEKQQEQAKFEYVLSRQKYITIFVLVGLGLLFLFTIMFIQARNNQKLRILNRELEHRNHDLNQFTYITSHDLKEPIRNIKSFSALLERQLKKEKVSSETVNEYLGYISNGSQTLYKIVESLQVYTKISNGKTAHEKLSLSSVFDTVKNNLNAYIGEKNGQLIFSNPDQIENIYFSEAMLQLILQNLIQNGFKHNESLSPVVEVSVKKAGRETMFKVSDNGKGIPPHYFEKIFQPFQTLQNKSTTQSSGLGLAICKNILLKFGKEICVDSDGKSGSSFHFSI